jgi:serine/threonine-protein kinase
VETSTHLPDRPPSQIGSLRVLCELGRGSMAVVYLARAQGAFGFERLFALKMILPHLSEQKEFVDLFLNEARIAARIHHPNVLAVHDIDLHEGLTYLKMDYASGETLAQALDRTWNQGTPFPIPIAAQIVSSVADGLHAAHELRDSAGAPLQVIHRDVGPHNILIGYDGVVRVMDFGIAKALDRVSGTRPGILRGTAAFMSPEHVRGEPLDRRADLFSLGVVLWETTVGARLFRHRTMAGTLTRIVSMPVPQPSTIRPEYPPALERIVMKALERDRDKRYATAQELADDLRQFLVGTGVAPSASPIARFMNELFPERHNQRMAMEKEATRNDFSGQIKSVLAPAPVVEVKRQILESQLDFPAIVPEAVGEFQAAATVETVDIPHQPDVLVIPEAEPSPPASPASAQALLGRAATPNERTRGRGLTEVTARTEALVPNAPSIPPKRELEGADPRLAVTLVALLLIGAGLAITLMVRLGSKHEEPVVEAPPLAMVRLSFALDPPEASLRVDGASQAGDLVVPLSPKEYTVEVTAEGFKKRTLVVSAEASQTITVHLDPLEAERTPPPARRTRRGRHRR